MPTIHEVQEWVKAHKTMVVLGVKNERELLAWKDKLIALEAKFAYFIEPDFGNQLTAIAVHPAMDEMIFKKLRLL